MSTTIMTNSNELLIDIHSHILYGLDDGVKDLEHSVACLKQASDMGCKQIICTPHIYYEDGEDHLGMMKASYQALKPYVEQLGMKIYPGNELLLTTHTVSLLHNKQALSLNRTSYVLVELRRFEPFDFEKLTEFLEDLMDYGYRPILAHPEFYVHYRKVSMIEHLIKMGVLIQITASSMISRSRYRKEYQFVNKLLKKRLVHFVASDVHGSHHRNYTECDEGYQCLRKKYPEDYVRKICYDNPKKVLEGDRI